MAAEVECKIMDMTIDEFLSRAEAHGLEVNTVDDLTIVDQYWEAQNGNLIRLRTWKLINGELWPIDLTIKGEEENDSNHVSSRPETVIKLSKNFDQTSVSILFSHLDVKKKCEIKKHRTFLNCSMGEYKVILHHDFVEKDDGGYVQWVEIESKDGESRQVYDFLVAMGMVGDEKQRVSKESTLDILKIL